MGLPFLRPMDIDPLGPSDWARWAFVFILFSYPLTPFGSSLSAEGGQLGWRSNRHMLTVRCSWVDGRNIGVNGDRLNWDDSWNAKQTVTRFIGWRSKCHADGDKVYGMMVQKEWGRQCTEFWQAAQKHLWRTTHVVSRLVYISDRSIASSSVHFSYKIHHPSSHFSAFRKKHIVRASSSSLLEIRSFNSCIIQSHPLIFSLVSNFIRSICFFFQLSFFLLAKIYDFLCLSPFLNLSFLGFVTMCRQCLVHQVTSRSSMTGRVTKNCTHRVIEIQTI